jgi:hypothetical protein
MRVFHRYYRYPRLYNTIVGQGSRPNLRGELIRRSLLIRTYKPRAAKTAAREAVLV